MNFGIRHVGEAVPQADIVVLNDAPDGPFSERLNASFGPLGPALVTNGGSITRLAPQASNGASMTIGIDTSIARSINSTATIQLQSDGTGVNSLGLMPLPTQNIQVVAQVNNFAAADILKLAGDGTFTMTGANAFTLNLGTVVMGEPSLQAELGVINDAVAPADDLAGSFALAAPDFTLTGFNPFSGLAAGGTQGGLMVELDTDTIGMFSGQITLSPRSTNARPFSMDLAPITIQLQGEVVPIPEPASIVIALLAVAIAGVWMRRRQRG